MKTLTTLLAAALVAASLGAHAQSAAATSPATATSAVAKSQTTKSAPAALTGAGSADTNRSAVAATEPAVSPAAMRARASVSHRPGARGVPAATSKIPGFKDGVTMRDSKVVVTESGHSMVLTDSVGSVKLVTGLEASSTGVVTRPDGTTETLKEGDYISITGRFEVAQERINHSLSLKDNLKEDRKKAARKARSPLGRMGL